MPKGPQTAEIRIPSWRDMERDAVARWHQAPRSPHAKAVGEGTFAELTAIWKP